MAVIYTNPSSPDGADIRPGVVNSEDDLWLFRVPVAAPQLLDGVVDLRPYEGALISRREIDPETGEWVTVQRDLYGVAPVLLDQITYSYSGGEYFITQYFWIDWADSVSVKIVAATISNAAGQFLGSVSGNVAKVITGGVLSASDFVLQ